MNKKILLGLGSVMAVAAPVAAVVSCGTEDFKMHVKTPDHRDTHTISLDITLPRVSSTMDSATAQQAFRTAQAPRELLTLFAAPADISDDNKGAQVMIDWLYRIGEVNMNYNISIEGENRTTKPPVTSTLTLDFSTLIDIDELNNIKDEAAFKTFMANMAQNMTREMAKAITVFSTIFSNATFTRWKGLLSTAGAALDQVILFPLQNGGINLGMNAAQLTVKESEILEVLKIQLSN